MYEPILITEMWDLVLGLGFGAVTNKRDTHVQMIHFHIERRRYRTYTHIYTRTQLLLWFLPDREDDPLSRNLASSSV